MLCTQEGKVNNSKNKIFIHFNLLMPASSHHNHFAIHLNLDPSPLHHQYLLNLRQGSSLPPICMVELLVGVHMQQLNDYVNHIIHTGHCLDNADVDLVRLIEHIVMWFADFCPCTKYFLPTHFGVRNNILD